MIVNWLICWQRAKFVNWLILLKAHDARLSAYQFSPYCVLHTPYSHESTFSYSYLKDSTGFPAATLSTWELTVNSPMTITTKPARRKCDSFGTM